MKLNILKLFKFLILCLIPLIELNAKVIGKFTWKMSLQIGESGDNFKAIPSDEYRPILPNTPWKCILTEVNIHLPKKFKMGETTYSEFRAIYCVYGKTGINVATTISCYEGNSVHGDLELYDKEKRFKILIFCG